MTSPGDRILGLGLLVLAVAEAVGPETFPTILAVVLVACSLYLMINPDPDARPFSWRCYAGRSGCRHGGDFRFCQFPILTGL